MRLLITILLIIVTTVLHAQTTLVSYGSSWKYLDNGSNQGTNWRNLSFNDAGWSTGIAELGYGDGDETTIVSYGNNANKKHITTYFRKIINVANPSSFSDLTLSLKRDDGAIVYINGIERYRTLMPNGNISYTTKASAEAPDDGETPQVITIPSSSLVAGNNVIAVEIHQRAANNSDITFDLQLLGNSDTAPPVITNLSPADNSTAVSSTVNLVLTFNEPVQKGSGNILIKENGSVTQTIDVNAASVAINGTAVTINPSDFTLSAAVNVEIVAGAFTDLSNNSFAGISNPADWNFSIQGSSGGGPETLVAFGDSWKYLDNGTNQGTAWRSTGFDDGSWASGNAELGYGDGDESTVVSFGPNASAKYITTYFRKTINVTNASAFTVISGSVRRDDGIAIYINGAEVYRNNLAAGAGYTTLASLANDDGETAQLFSISPSAFVTGSNVIAVEIHQNSASSTDISFDLELIGNSGSGGTILTRGPYLQMANQTAVSLRWRTDIATDSKIEVGTVHGNYTLSATNPEITTEHEIRITGLDPDTKYFYRFGSSGQVIQNGVSNYFITAPPANTTRKIRVAAFGDCGRNDNGFQTGTLNAYQSVTGTNPAEIMLLLGDNAYNSGLDTEYSSGFFSPYQGTILKNHNLFPAPGNHDYGATGQASRNGAYYQNFSMPTGGECGGVASGTEAFYSFDWGNIHFISMDSYGTESPNNSRLYDTLGPQVTWVKQDLAANTKKWTVVYWHHPPHTKGSHNSDTETELINIRTNFVRILERYGVDLILCGHSHNYERSYLLKDYFGNESTFNPGVHAASNSSAKYNGTTNSCPYSLTGGQVNHGTVYVVAGSAGADGGVQSGYPHNAFPWSIDDGGMLYFEVEDNRLDARFIRRDGVVADQFTIMKDVNRTIEVPSTPGVPVQLTASWVGSYNWNTGETTRTVTVSPLINTTYTVTDGAGCIADVYNVTMSPVNRPVILTESNLSTIQVHPTLVRSGQPVTIRLTENKPAEAMLIDIQGRVLEKFTIADNYALQTKNLNKGMFFIRLKTEKGLTTFKFVVTD